MTYTVPNLYLDMLTRPHLLIAGATGSGKSVAINGLIYTAMAAYGDTCSFILIDPKRVELADYKAARQTIVHASEPDTMISALKTAMNLTESRYRQMAKRRQKKLLDHPVYVIIDELADLMTTCRRDVLPLIQRLCQIGRAANVHVIAATQCPLVKVIPTEIKVNFDCRLALRTAQAQHSRNIIDMTGCELLPLYGEGFYQTPESTTKYKIPMIPEEDIRTIISRNRKGFFAALFCA